MSEIRRELNTNVLTDLRGGIAGLEAAAQAAAARLEIIRERVVGADTGGLAVFTVRGRDAVRITPKSGQRIGGERAGVEHVTCNLYPGSGRVSAISALVDAPGMFKDDPGGGSRQDYRVERTEAGLLTVTTGSNDQPPAGWPHLSEATEYKYTVGIDPPNCYRNGWK